MFTITASEIKTLKAVVRIIHEWVIYTIIHGNIKLAF